MRKLMWFSIGFAAAVLVGAYVIMGSLSAVLGIGLGLVAVGCAFLVRNNKAMRILAHRLVVYINQKSVILSVGG